MEEKLREYIEEQNRRIRYNFLMLDTIKIINCFTLLILGAFIENSPLLYWLIVFSFFALISINVGLEFCLDGNHRDIDFAVDFYLRDGKEKYSWQTKAGKFFNYVSSFLLFCANLSFVYICLNKIG